MQKVSKGTTLVEIMISVILISVILIFVFNILADLKSEDNLSSKRSEDALARASYTRIIQNDFIDSTLIGVSPCSEGLICLNFSFRKNNATKKLVIFNDYLVYADEKWKLSYGSYLKNQAKLTYRVATRDNAMLSDSDVINYSYLKIYIPVTYNTISNRKYDLELVYSYTEPLSINCTTLKNYFVSQNVDCN